ncbi:hypothetical protein GQ42DRAFT_179210 [Ramicandelaber brevisporus]|nr:hypothetical protein GQ42DRAFT_179210 [Ramicandelaber brevisporus]
MAAAFSNSGSGHHQQQPQQQSNQRSVSIYSILWRLHFKPIIPALLCYLNTAVTTALLPLLIRALIRFAQASYHSVHGSPSTPGASAASEHSSWYGYGLIIVYTVALMGINFFDEYASLVCLSTGQKLRVQFASQMLSKIFRISQQSRSKMSIGSLINLVGSDSAILMRAFGRIPSMVISLIQMSISIVILFVFLGSPALVGCALLVLYYPLQQWLAMRIYKIRKRLATVTDERIRLIRETLQGIRVVKCFVWESAMIDRVAVLHILLLDDPLSAVDANVGRALFDQCLSNEAPLAENKTRILVTHQLSVLPRVDYIVCLDGGRIVEQGTFHDLMARRGNLFEMVSIYNNQAHQTDIEVTQRSNCSTIRLNESTASVELRTESFGAKERVQSLMQAEEQEVGSVPFRVLQMYVSAAGGFAVIVALLPLLILSHTSTVGADLWLSAWTMGHFPALPMYANILMYIGLGLAYGLFLLIAQLIGCIAGQAAAKLIHSQTLKCVLYAPMVWFDTTKIGQTLSRFSDDTGQVDSILPPEMVSLLELLISCIGPLIVISVLFPFFLIPCIVVVPFIVYFGMLFVRSIREMKRYRSRAQSSAAAYFSEMLNGVNVITSFGLQSSVLNRFHSLLDETTRVEFHAMCMYRWIRLYPALCADLLALSAGILLVHARNDTPSSIVGLVMTYCLRFVHIWPTVFRRLPLLEDALISVERLHQYMHIETEPECIIDAENRAIEEWKPSSGAVEFRNVVFRYRPGLEPVLHSVSFSIKAGEKIGVVGRTGASKSTLVQVLSRLYHISERDRLSGGIFIDGVDASTISLRDLRSSIAVIPQDPVLFRGSIRFNLDPFGRFDDADLNQALDSVGLAGHSDIGLDSLVSEGGANLSAGQSQLLCLARTMLVKARIVVLDEATASVDAVVDEKIQLAIRTDFSACTVITIAHRLNTIMDYDRVIVMDAGQVVETGSPQGLLANPHSQFAQMAASHKSHS